ncbi:MAG TPA: hydrolase 1, exosortase A system-associated [Burkholderiales bacterium]|nr:hydrolase 1, exosortase A system-associated [Burkholderiales bacterium]
MVTLAYEERALTFECAGERLVGIVAAPHDARVGLVIVVGGPQYRAGSHRQYVLLARRLASAGVAVMRFDYRGLGDATGAMIPFEEAVADVAAAMDAFAAACPSLERIVLWGLCDAASLALLYWHATRDRRVAGLVLADPWITSEQEFAQSQARHYLARPFQLAFWKKLVSGGVDVKGALADVKSVLGTLARRGSGAAAAAAPFQQRMSQGLADFHDPVLLVLSGDLTARDFRQYCETHAEWQNLIARDNVAHGNIPDANHTFAGAAARGEVERLTAEWLAANVTGRS